MLPPLLLAAALDGEAALHHASALAALGPHPWGSPRAPVAAEYVASQFRAAGGFPPAALFPPLDPGSAVPRRGGCH